MNEEARRLTTFINWPSNAPVDAGRIAKAGFYYLGCDLDVQCFSCQGVISQWCYNDTVMTRHRTLDPNCPFVLSPALSGNVPITNDSNTSGNYRACPEDSILNLVPTTMQGPDSLSDFNRPSTTNSHAQTRITPIKTNISSEMSSLSSRLATFVNWPVSFIVTPERLAEAGFYYVHQGDRVKCAFCNVVVGRWENGDDPLEEHVRHSPECRFLQSDINTTQSDSSNGILFRQGVGEINDSTMAFLGVQNHSVAKHPNYSSKDLRLATYVSWPNTVMQTPDDLAEAGFYYAGSDDQVRCFHCDGCLRRWDSEDDPWVEHARWFPDCGFVICNKGVNFVKVSIEKYPPIIPEQAHLSSPGSSSTSNRRISEAQYEELLSSPAATAALQIGLDLARVKMAICQQFRETGRFFSSAHDLIEAALNVQLDEVSYQESTEETWSTPLQSPRHFRTTGSHSASQFRESTITSNHSSDTPELESLTSGNGDSSALPKAVSTCEPNATPEVTLEEENRRLREARLCKICMDSEVCVVFLPCGHLVTCVVCAHSLGDCPVCRRTIKATVRTFLS